MAQFDVLAVEFDFPQDEDQPAQLKVIIDNPQHMELYGAPDHIVPSDVQEVPAGEAPSQQHWVHSGNFHLTISLQAGAGDNPLIVSNTDYYNFGSGPTKLLDVVIAEQRDNDKKTRRIRRKVSGVATD